jgi:DNA helicase-2/ATP-dependent DNA helicase PcrA
MVEGIERLIGASTEPGEIAILVRINAQLPEIEQALTRAGIPFVVRGQRFFERQEVREARRILGKASIDETGTALAKAVRALFVERLGLDAAGAGPEAAERAASLQLLLGVVQDLARSKRRLRLPDVLAELDRRDAAEAAGSSAGVNLLTYHRAKGLEWDAVFLPSLEEGLLPVRQAKDDAAIAEERRLLYVGITRARRRLALSWAARRTGPSGKDVARKPSRFLEALERTPAALRPSSRATWDYATGLPPRMRALDQDADDGASAAGAATRSLLEALQGWRRARSRTDGVPAYVIAHDAVLVSIAESRPGSETALEAVKGMGPAKVERYGKDILAIVARSG